MAVTEHSTPGSGQGGGFGDLLGLCGWLLCPQDDDSGVDASASVSAEGTATKQPEAGRARSDAGWAQLPLLRG